MVSPAKVCQVPNLAIIRGLLRRLEKGQQFCHSWLEDGVCAPYYAETCEGASKSCKTEAELQAEGYAYKWQQKRWCFWRDCRQLPTFSPNLHDAGRPAEELSGPEWAYGGHHTGAAILGDFIAVIQRFRAKPRLLPLRRSVEQRRRAGPEGEASHSSTMQSGWLLRAHLRRASQPLGCPRPGL